MAANETQAKDPLLSRTRRAGHDSSFHVRSVDTFKNVAVERRLFGSVLRYVNPFEAASEWDADSEEGLPNSPDARFVT